MAQVKVSELSKIPFIDSINLQGRWLPSLTFYVEDEWSMWIPTEKGLQKIKGWPAEAFYFGDKPESEYDIYLHFLDFLAQKASFQPITKPLRGLDDDFFNLSASVAKIDFLYEKRDEFKQGISRMVATEIEYIFSVCRSIFDLLQEIISKLWGTIQLIDGNIKKQPIPETFSKMTKSLYHNNDHKILVKKYGLPPQLAEFYTRYFGFFSSLKEFRDNVSHRGSSIEMIFSTEKGFAVRENQVPFSRYEIWTEEHKQKNGLCSLRPAIGYTIHETLSACETFSTTIDSIIQFPPPLVPGLKLFMRGYFNQNLIETIKSVDECKWWNA
jgi:hypothetical protein